MVQARAQATRQAILDAAVRLFGEIGYGNAALSEVIEAAGVTKGAACYHFASKESVAVALVEEADTRIAETIASVLAHPGPALENLIRATFVIADLSQSDPAVHIGVQLCHGLPQISTAIPGGYTGQQELAVDGLRAAVSEGDLRADVDPDAVGHTLFVAMVGNHLKSEATGRHPRDGLLTVWRILLRGILAEDSAEFFDRFLDRMGHQSASAALQSGQTS